MNEPLIELYVQVKNSQGATVNRLIDINGDTTIPLTLQAFDINNITGIFSSYSKTINVPDTHNNMDVFNYLSNLNKNTLADINAFNPNLFHYCFLKVDGLINFEGYLQVPTIIINEDTGSRQLSIVIFSNLVNFVTSCNNKYLQDLNIQGDGLLDYSQYNHIYSTTNIVDSWTSDYQNGYFYPLIDYGFDFQQNIPPVSVFNTPQIFYPATYLKPIMDNIFFTNGITVNSNFFNSEFYKNLIIPFNGTTFGPSTQFVNDNSFTAQSGTSQSYVSIFPNDPNNPYITTLSADSLLPMTENGVWVMRYNEKMNFQYDLSTLNNLWDLTNSWYLNPVNNAPLMCAFQINVNIDLPLEYGTIWPFPDSLQLLVYRSNSFDLNGNVVATNDTEGYLSYVFNLSDMPNTTFGDLSVNIQGSLITPFYQGQWNSLKYGSYGNWIPPYYFDVYEPGVSGDNETNPSLSTLYPIQPGEKVWLVYDFGVAYTIPSVNSGLPQININLIQFQNVISKTVLPNTPVDYNNCIPQQIQQIDLFNSVVKLFNLHVEIDKLNPAVVNIEPHNDYYSAGVLKDWTKKVDLSQAIQEDLLSEQQNLTNLFTYKTGEGDALNTLYTTNTKTTYGQFIYTIPNSYVLDQKTIDVIFAPTVLNQEGLINAYDQECLILSNMSSVTQNNTAQVPQTNWTIRLLQRNTAGLIKTSIPNNNIGVNDVIGTPGCGFYFVSEIELPLSSNYILCPGSYYNPTGTVFDGIFYDYNIYFGYLYWIYGYPYAGHYDHPDPAKMSSDLNWGFVNNMYPMLYQPTLNTLFNKYWKGLMDQIADPSGRQLTLSIYLDALDIYNFQFNDVIMLNIDNTLRYFNVNNIQFDPSINQPAKVVLYTNVDYTLVKPSITSFEQFVGNTQNNNISTSQNNNITVSSAIVNGTGNVVTPTNTSVQSIQNTNNPPILQLKTATTITGSYNKVAGASVISGNNNFVGPHAGVNNITGNNNIVESGVSNVNVVGDNMLITGVNSGMMMVSKPMIQYSNLISAGKDIILNPFNTTTVVNIVNAGKDSILDLGSITPINSITAK